MKFKLFTAFALAGLIAAQAGYASPRVQPNGSYPFDDEQPWVEQDYQLPTYPTQPNWQEFFLSNRGANRLFVDLTTFSAGQDGVLRYVLRQQSPSGAQNVSLEGIRCQGRQMRNYAFGDTVHQRWIEALKVVWRPIDLDDRVHRELRDALCPDGIPVRDQAEALRRLRATR